MHEWALAEAIISAANETADKEDLKKVTEIKIRVGQLQQIEIDILQFALSQQKSAKLKDAKFIIETAKTKLGCRACGHRWFFAKKKLNKNDAEAIHFVPEIAHTYVKCPKCGSPDFEIQEGRGVWLQSLKGVR